MLRLLIVSPPNSVLGSVVKYFFSVHKSVELDVVCTDSTTKRANHAWIKVMDELGVDFEQLLATDCNQKINARYFDIVITTCDGLEEQLSILPGNPVLIHWQLQDLSNDLTVCRELREQISLLTEIFFKHGYLQALTNARQFNELILNNISDGIIAHDLNKNIFYFNKAAEEITGYKQAEVINRNCHDVFPNNFCGDKCNFCDKPAKDIFNIIRKNITIKCKNGNLKEAEMIVKPIIKDQKVQGVLASFKDLSFSNALSTRRLKKNQFCGIIGRNKKMLDMFELISDVADVNVPVMIYGESGTGKELVANAIHSESSRANKLFVPVNCGALPEQLLSSELFGHVKGAFTGAVRDKKGRFELADKGTIFLDEIGDISQAMQVKLLRVLQEGTFERVGSEETVKVDVRVISATHKNLQDEIKAGRFREDLYYRLGVIPLNLPPLRERQNDIPLLVEYFFKKMLKQFNKADISISTSAIEVMKNYLWPGNIRELQNWLQFALVKCKGDEILPEHFPIKLAVQIETVPQNIEEKNGERKKRSKKLNIDAVQQALQQCNGNKAKAAKLLGVGRATLYRFLDS